MHACGAFAESAFPAPLRTWSRHPVAPRSKNRGRPVIVSDGLAIGEIAVLFIDSDAWRVESLRVKLRKDIADRLGADRSMFHAGALEIPTSMVQSVGNAVILSVAIDGVRQVLPGASESAPAR
jgi:sporulation protein YlmC with PRC-barrel domain